MGYGSGMYFEPYSAFMSIVTMLLPIAAVAALVCLSVALIAATGTLRAYSRAKRVQTDLMLAGETAGDEPRAE